MQNQIFPSEEWEDIAWRLKPCETKAVLAQKSPSKAWFSYFSFKTFPNILVNCPVARLSQWAWFIKKREGMTWHPELHELDGQVAVFPKREAHGLRECQAKRSNRSPNA